MSRFHFVKPSLWRVVWSVLAVAAACGVLMGIVLYGYAIATHHDPQPTPKGEYVRLFILNITFWGPLLVLTIWQITMPLILLVGLLFSAVRKAPKENPA